MRKSRRKNKIFSAAVAVTCILAALLVLMSGVMLCDRMGIFAIRDDDPATIIPLVPERSSGSGSSSSSSGGDFNVSDEDNDWTTDTEVDLFKISYENGEGKITVAGDGDKLVAPGTSNSYTFRLENNGDAGVDYQMAMEMFLSAEGIDLPIVVRVMDHNGNYLLGDADQWSELEGLNEVSSSGSLSGDHYVEYTIEWQWPFEGDDEFDTFLGNMSAKGETEFTLTVLIHTLANENTEAGGGEPETGEFPYMVIWFALAVVTVFALLLVIFGWRREEDEDEA